MHTCAHTHTPAEVVPCAIVILVLFLNMLE